MNDINFNFFNFGPLVVKSEIPQEDVSYMLDICKQQTTDFRRNLAGKIEYEKGIDKSNSKIIFNKLKKYIDFYVDELKNRKQENLKINPIIDELWVNIQKSGEYNPPHMHSSHISFVVYLSIPDELKKEKKIGTGYKAGSITFQFMHGTKTGILDSYKSNFNFIADKLIEPQFSINYQPKNGDILIFPSYLFHYVDSFETPNVERISMAGNVLLTDGEKKYII